MKPKSFFRGNNIDLMPNWAFRAMAFMFNIADLFKSPAHKLDPFDIKTGQTVIDYGSGTGRFLPQASAMVGESGKVYGVDIHPIAVQSAKARIIKHNLKNTLAVLTDGKSVSIPSHTADVIYALDMFHMVKDTTTFLKELHRLTNSSGIFYLEDGHQPRTVTREKVLNSGCWDIIHETGSFISCRPKTV